MLTAKKSPKSSSGPGGSMWGPPLGENICMVDCARGKDYSCTCARTGPGPGPGPARTTVKSRSRPPLRFSSLESDGFWAGPGCERFHGEVRSLFSRAGTSHVGTLAMKTEPHPQPQNVLLCLGNSSQRLFTVSAQIGQ